MSSGAPSSDSPIEQPVAAEEQPQQPSVAPIGGESSAEGANSGTVLFTCTSRAGEEENTIAEEGPPFVGAALETLLAATAASANASTRLVLGRDPSLFGFNSPLFVQQEQQSSASASNDAAAAPSGEGDKEEEGGGADGDDASPRLIPLAASPLPSDAVQRAAMRAPMPCLRCDHCRNVLCLRGDLYTDVAATFSDQVYTYDLEILGSGVDASATTGASTPAPVATPTVASPPTGEGGLIASAAEEKEKEVATRTPPPPHHYPVYSATNPAAVRFDVARVSAACHEAGLVACQTKAFFAEHSWFPPYYWCMAACGSCGQHLGWGFAEPDVAATAEAQSDFEAKRVTELCRLRDESAARKAKVEARKARALEKRTNAAAAAAAKTDQSSGADGSSDRKRARESAGASPAVGPSEVAVVSSGGSATPNPPPRQSHVDPNADGNTNAGSARRCRV